MQYSKLQGAPNIPRGSRFARNADSLYWQTRFSRRAGPYITIPRLSYRLNALPSGTHLLAQRPHDRVDNVAADIGSSPDALDKIFPSHHCRRTIDQLAENLGFQRREFDCASFHHDLTPIACEIQVVAMSHSTWAGIDQSR